MADGTAGPPALGETDHRMSRLAWSHLQPKPAAHGVSRDRHLIKPGARVCLDQKNLEALSLECLCCLQEQPDVMVQRRAEDEVGAI